MLMNMLNSSENLNKQIDTLIRIWFFLSYIRKESALIAVFQDKENHTSGLEYIINLYNIVVLESSHEVDFVGDKLFDFFLSNHVQI